MMSSSLATLSQGPLQLRLWLDCGPSWEASSKTGKLGGKHMHCWHVLAAANWCLLQIVSALSFLQEGECAEGIQVV